MKVYFVRHAETNANKNKILMGLRTDGSLNEAGITQAKELSTRLDKDFDLIFSSHLKRAAETAEIIGRELNISIVYRDALAERDFGSLSGRSWDDLYRATGIDYGYMDKALKYDYRPFGGDSVETVKERLLKFIEELKNDYGNKKILVVSHGGILRLMHSLFPGKERAELANASVHEFTV